MTIPVPPPHNPNLTPPYHLIMKTKYLLFLLPALAALSGCAVSLQPFYTPTSLIDDPALEGRWTDNEEATWLVTRTSPGHFDIAECTPDHCTPDTEAVLFRTAGVTFLDFTEKTPAFSSAFHLHGLFGLHHTQDQLDLQILDSDRIAKLAGRHELDTEFAETDSGAILTARPANLQVFALRHLADGSLFGEPLYLTKQ